MSLARFGMVAAMSGFLRGTIFKVILAVSSAVILGVLAKCANDITNAKVDQYELQELEDDREAETKLREEIEDNRQMILELSSSIRDKWAQDDANFNDLKLSVGQEIARIKELSGNSEDCPAGCIMPELEE